MSEFKIGRHRGNFVAEWYDENGKRRRSSLGTSDLATAKRKLGEIESVNAFQNRLEAKTLSDLWSLYIVDKAELARADTMREQWKSVGPAFGHLAADGIAREHTVEYILTRKKLGRKASTIWSELVLVSLILNWGVRQHLVEKISHIAVPPQPPPKNLWLTKSQAQVFLTACGKPHLRLFVLLALGTAGRKEAILQLTWDRVDFDRCQINLQKPTTRRQKGRAVVPMSNELRAALLEAQTGAISDYVIEWNGLAVADVKKGLKAAGKRCELPWVSAHVFRHSAAVWLAEGGTNMSVIAQFLGHGGTRETERVYARYSPDFMRGVTDRLSFVTSAVPVGTNVPKMKNKGRK